jgi:hypothetical protein
LVHDPDHPLREHVDLILPLEHFPRVATGCGRPLCGQTRSCPANERE